MGSSGLAKIIIDIVEKEKKYNIVGLVDKFRKIDEETLGYKIIGKDKDIPILVKTHNLDGGIIAIGDNWIRSRVYENIKFIQPNFKFVSIIHPSAQIGKSVSIGNGTVIMAGVIINSNSSIGNHCLLTTNSSLGHDSCMEDFSSLASNATIGGNVKIGKFSAICLGTNIIHKITIGEQTVVGAGSVVVKNIPKFSVVYGVPAKFIRERKAGDKYL